MYSFNIQSPLLVFDEVHRETGTIERTCIFTNNTNQDVELEVSYDFSEHSWIQIYGPQQNGRDIVDGDLLCLQPGENRALLSLNTDNFNFPDARFRGRVLFADRADRQSRDWLEISFERVQEFKPFVGYAAIDLGTSSSTIALYHIRGNAVSRMPWTPALEGSESTVPSAVYLESFHRFVQRERSGYLVGRDALRKCRETTPKDPRCLQLGTKRLIGARRTLVTDERGAGGFVDPLDVLYALGKHLRERAQSHPDVHALIRKVNVTYPPTWSHRELSRWKELFQRLGYGADEVDFSLDEASAAGLFYIYNCVRESDSLKKLVQDLLPTEEDLLEDGQRGKGYVLDLLCFDFGGGTTDLALIEAKLEVFEKRLRLRLSLIGSDSYNFGGDQVTLAVFRILKRRLAMALCDPVRMHEDVIGRPNGRETQPVRSYHEFLRGDEEAEFVLPDSPTSTFSGQPGDSADAPAGRRTIQENWGYLCAHLTSESLEAEIEDAVDQLFPTRFFSSDADPCRIDARRNFDWLWDQAEQLKISLLGEVQSRHRESPFPSFSTLKGVRRGVSLRDVPLHFVSETIPWAGEPVCESLISVGADELWSAVAGNLREAVARARELAGSKTIDRVVLSGQSCRMPMVRWLLSSSRGEGGIGIPPAKIEFDEANAKAGVSKGACLLNVVRETLVGFDLDVADFKANLLSDIFYVEVDGSHRTLFAAGAIDDLAYVEETPELRSFPKYLSIFYGSESNLIGQFLLDDEGERLPPVPASAGSSALAGRNGAALANHADVLELRETNRDLYTEIVAELLRWSEPERIAWMESTATPGSSTQPRYRFYLTRNHNLFAVRDRGPGRKSLFPLEAAEMTFRGPLPHQDPFSGIH